MASKTRLSSAKGFRNSFTHFTSLVLINKFYGGEISSFVIHTVTSKVEREGLANNYCKTLVNEAHQTKKKMSR